MHHKLKQRCNFVGVGLLEALIYSGTLDIFGLSKKQMIDSKESYNEIFAKHLEDTIEDKSEYDFAYLKNKENEYLGFNITYNLFVDYDKKINYYKASLIKSIYNQKYSKILVCFESIKEIKTKKNQLMLVGSVRDNESEIDYVIFPSDYEKMVKPSRDGLYLVDCLCEQDVKTNKFKVIIRNITKVN